MKVLVFDIWGDYGHFRKFYTTTSPLTFSFPPPSTIAGILGAIYGTEKNKYLNIFALDKCNLSIKIVNLVKKVRMGINLMDTKGTNLKVPFSDKRATRTQIRTEFLKDPYFRIYFTHNDKEILDNLSKFVKEHKSTYTVSLGLSELLADFKYIGLYDSESISNSKTVEIATPVAAGNLITDGLEIETGKKYFKEKIPIIMNSERIIEKYDDIIFEPEGKTIKAKLKTYYTLENGENITFF